MTDEGLRKWFEEWGHVLDELAGRHAFMTLPMPEGGRPEERARMLAKLWGGLRWLPRLVADLETALAEALAVADPAEVGSAFFSPKALGKAVFVVNFRPETPDDPSAFAVTAWRALPAGHPLRQRLAEAECWRQRETDAPCILLGRCRQGTEGAWEPCPFYLVSEAVSTTLEMRSAQRGGY